MQSSDNSLQAIQSFSDFQNQIARLIARLHDICVEIDATEKKHMHQLSVNASKSLKKTLEMVESYKNLQVESQKIKKALILHYQMHTQIKNIRNKLIVEYQTIFKETIDSQQTTKIIQQIINKNKLLQLHSMQMMQKKKQMNRQLQEKKGKLRIYLRLRPYAQTEKISYEIIQNVLKIKTERKEVYDEKKKKIISTNFSFDHIFTQETEQSQIFDKVQDAIQSSIDGQNVFIFAYGQTGSGKTHTMNGNLKQGQQGLIPRSLSYIFKQINYETEKGYTYEIKMSVSEIYLNKVYDLLDGKTQKKSQKQLVSIQCLTAEAALIALRKSINIRTIGKTFINQTSSRSHGIVQIKIKCVNAKSNLIQLSSLTLVDLAGNEKFQIGGVTGEQTKSINLSLMKLRGLLKNLRSLSLGKNEKFFSDGDVLSQMLKQKISNSGKAIMFINISTSMKSLNQTMQTLAFGQIST